MPCAPATAARAAGGPDTVRAPRAGSGLRAHRFGVPEETFPRRAITRSVTERAIVPTMRTRAARGGSRPSTPGKLTSPRRHCATRGWNYDAPRQGSALVLPDRTRTAWSPTGSRVTRFGLPPRSPQPSGSLPSPCESRSAGVACGCARRGNRDSTQAERPERTRRRRSRTTRRSPPGVPAGFQPDSVSSPNHRLSCFVTQRHGDTENCGFFVFSPCLCVTLQQALFPRRFIRIPTTIAQNRRIEPDNSAVLCCSLLFSAVLCCSLLFSADSADPA